MERCFPFWAERASHPRGGFRERVALDGAPLDDDVSRVRVQARQTYLFARAALMGWEPERARALAQRGVTSILGPCRRDDGLFGRTVRPGIALVDRQPELYDNAFCLLALAWAARALSAPELIGEADATLAALDRSLAHPAGGFQETLPPRLPRRQNPHMHLFEASLALLESSATVRHRARADTLLALFETRFFDPATQTVRELLDDALAPAETEADRVVEPGHAFEWTALLHHHARVANMPLHEHAGALYAGALRALDTQGLAPMGARPSGEAVDASRRTWSQTEALRAHVARADAGDAAAAVKARALLDAIFAVHLDPAPPGAWIDHIDADGQPSVDAITAATGYHVVTAFAEAVDSPAMQSAGDTP
jgi:mannose-6-phosphate isomerase